MSNSLLLRFSFSVNSEHWLGDLSEGGGSSVHAERRRVLKFEEAVGVKMERGGEQSVF